MGDVVSAGLVFVGTMLHLSPQNFAAINAGLALVWFGVLWGVAREHRKLTTVEKPVPAGAAVQPA